MRDNNFGKNLVALRVCKGLTLADLSSCVQINAKSINKDEMGMLLPTVSNLCAISEYFGIDTDTLLKKEIILRYDIKPDIKERS